MKVFEVYREGGYLDLVDVIHASSYAGAVRKAKLMGYGKGFRLQGCLRPRWQTHPCLW